MLHSEKVDQSVWTTKNSPVNVFCDHKAWEMFGRVHTCEDRVVVEVHMYLVVHVYAASLTNWLHAMLIFPGINTVRTFAIYKIQLLTRKWVSKKKTTTYVSGTISGIWGAGGNDSISSFSRDGQQFLFPPHSQRSLLPCPDGAYFAIFKIQNQSVGKFSVVQNIGSS